MRYKRTVDRVGRVMMVITIVAAVIFLTGPLVIGIGMSFDARNYLATFPPPELSLKWYESFFSDTYYMEGLKTSLSLAVLTTVTTTVIGTAAAIGLHRSPFRTSVSAFLLSPLVVPAVVIGFGLLLYLSALGVSNSFLKLLMGHIVVTLPYTIRTGLAALGGIRRSLVEAAMSLGASETAATWHIVVPLMRSGIVAGAIFAFAFSMDEVAISLFLTDPQNYTLPVALISMMKSNFNLTIAAASTLLTCMTAIIVVVLDRFVGLEKLIGEGVHQK